MISGVVQIKELFSLSFRNSELKEVIDSLHSNNARLSIPKYQREYKWSKAKIETFVKDIMKNSKFLGIVSFEKNTQQNKVDIVDGQQRITTLF